MYSSNSMGWYSRLNRDHSIKAQQGNKYIYLGSKTNSEKKNYTDINKKYKTALNFTKLQMEYFLIEISKQ
jgi:hypothetical protein